MTYTVEYSNRPEQREGTHLVLLLHGYGSHEQDLLGLVPHLPQENLTYVAMRAPQPVGAAYDPDQEGAYLPGAALGYQWWALNQSLNTNVRAIELASDYVIQWLEEHQDQYKDITLLGFSQGMAVATSVARHKPELVKAIIGLSGFVVEQESNYFKDAELEQSPIPLFYGRDQQDPVIPHEKVEFTLDFARGHFDTTSMIYTGMGHGINASEIAHVSEFMQLHVLQ